MPPSPALRYSPGRELRGENHKRGRSFESGILFREKDDDLALFNEMQSKERENFLLQSKDDFEDTFSTKLRHFSDVKLGISIPARGEGSELLNADGEKNDYDWLLTPPDTPLFPSLDDEPQLANIAPRGRPQSQPISISRSSTMDKSYRSTRGSASPNRLSPSPRSGNSAFQARGRPSSAPRTSPSPSLRSTTPTRRPSTPPNKSSTPATRSSTPNSRRLSAGVTTSGLRGTSPVRTTRGNSASPKIRAWQSNIPGFSLDAPPNLRTSLIDRPASYVRGSSPASRNGRGRQSMSPTASRSVSSLQSHERDRFSSHSKGSVASSGDDDIDSVQSVSLGGSNFSTPRRVSAFPNNRAPTFNKKPARMLSPSSAPKRSFDSALRQMDHWKSPPNMFRPLLSSVPSTSFYVGKGSAAHRAMISRNSSVTSSSNASSDRGTSFLLDAEGSDQHQDDMAGECGKGPSADVQEVFVFDKADASNQDSGHERQDSPRYVYVDDFGGDPAIDCDPAYSQEFSHHGVEDEMGSSSDAFGDRGDFSEVDSLENMKVCSRCGCRYRFSEPLEENIALCPDCSRQNDILPVNPPEMAISAEENSPVLSIRLSEESKSFCELEPSSAVADLPLQVTNTGQRWISQHEEDAKQSKNYSQENSLARSLEEGDEQRLDYQQEMDQHIVDHSSPDRGIGAQKLQLCNNSPESKGDDSLLDSNMRNQQLQLCNNPLESKGDNSLLDGDTGGWQLQFCNNLPESKVYASEVAGISVLLKKSSSSKGPIIQGRTFTASSLPYEDLSYTRDSSSSWRSSIGFGSASASSSIDYSSSRQTEIRVQWQQSGRKSDMENYRYDINAKPQSFGSSLSRSSSNAHQASGSAPSTREEIFELNISNLKTDDVEETPAASEANVVASENMEADVIDSSSTGTEVPGEIVFKHNESSRTAVPATSELSSNVVNVHPEEKFAVSLPNYEVHAPYEDEHDFPNIAESDSGLETSAVIPDSSIEELDKLSASLDGMDVAEVPTHSSLATISEIEIENCCQSSPSSEIVSVSPNSEQNKNEHVEWSVPTTSDVDVTASVEEPNNPDHADGILEDGSTVVVECQGGSKMRSLTLEEATDTILFCSSIVHDLAYQAATIAIEKESSMPLEDSRPTVMILGKSNMKDPRGRTGGRRTSKSLKAKQRKLETDKKSTSTKSENNENSDEEGALRNSSMRIVGLPNKEEDSTKPPKLESKCNCSIM
ncbi:hypothetical protein SLEP1_g25534 [Rubroshorea leprosula]|uniref:Uncharacterized protein n=1 Tax=Rubroshorea leprosula TaxID=152421 RepID=A0AAV5JTS3_9ROSI|nr:hypothetical protein SLEP1_g25534 [Rubroshorea leprosula]